MWWQFIRSHTRICPWSLWTTHRQRCCRFRINHFLGILGRVHPRQSTLGGHKGIHSLKFAEVYLLKPLSEESSKIEIECFQIAFVIYVVSNLLAPTAKHDYVTLDFLGSPANISTISSFNWCEFVLKHIVLAANKLNSDIASGASSIHMGGCHLFLQVFLFIFPSFFSYNYFFHPKRFTVTLFHSFRYSTWTILIWAFITSPS